MARYRGQVQAIASGRVAAPSGRLALEGAPPKQFMAELEARGWEGNRRVPNSDDEALADTVRRTGPLGVVCPACHAAIGRPCKTPGGTNKQPLGKPRPKPHSARLRAAQGVPEATTEQRVAQEQAIRAKAAAHLAAQQTDDDIPDAEIVEDTT